MRYDYDTFRQALQRNPDIRVDTSSLDALPPSELITSERAMQQAVVDEVQRRAIDEPEWGRLFAIPNELAYGRRPPPGVSRGVPDLFLPVPRVKRGVEYYGLWIELKVAKNALTGEQLEWNNFLRQQGYMVRTIRDDPREVIDLIAEYLEGMPL